MSDNLNLVFAELQKEIMHPELIKDGKLHFEYNGIIYRVRMPNQKELTEANNIRNRKFYALLQERDANGKPVYLLIKNLKKILKFNQCIDIDELDNQLEILKKQLIDVHLELAKITDSEIKTIEKYQKKIQTIKDQRTDIILEKAGYLAVAIEPQAEDVYYKTLTRFCTEQYVESGEGENRKGDFIKVWEKFDDYENDNSLLPNIALGKFTELYLNM